MPDILSLIWSRADTRYPIFHGDEFNSEGGNESALLRTGLIRQADNASNVICDACGDGHIEEVIFVESPTDSGLRAYIQCPENGRVSVPFERLKCWTIDFQVLTGAVSKALSLTGKPEELLPGRIWFLGKGTFAGYAREVFFARGLTWIDAGNILDRTSRILSASGHIVIVLGAIPNERVWKNEPLRVFSLSAIATVENGNVTIDWSYLRGILPTTKKKVPHTLPSFPTPAGATWPDVRVKIMGHSLSIEVKGLTKKYTFQEAGFEEIRRKAYPDQLWQFLTILGQHMGVLKNNEAAIDYKARTNLKKYISELRKRLQSLIPDIDGNPILYDSKDRAYKTAFKISTSENLSFSVPSGLNWSDVSIAMAGPNAIRIECRSTETFTGRTYGEDDHFADLELAEREHNFSQTVEFNQIKMATGDTVNSLGQALIAVIKEKGSVRRDARDKYMLSLGNELCELLRINESAFDFDPENNLWTAKFEVSIDP